MRLLRGGARDLPVRQQTLRATIEWSYQLLEPGEQRLFEVLSVFSGAGFEAVEVVAAELDWLTETQVDILDGLASLVDKSLLRQADAGAGEPRLVMLETIREYAAERLDDLPEFGAAARRGHAAYFAEFAGRQSEHLTGRRREPALAEMTTELENLRLAWDHWVVTGALDQLNKLVDSLWLLYDARGWYHDTVRLTTDLLEVRALMATKGYTPEVEEVYARTLELFEGRQVPQLFPVLRNLASFYNFRGEFDSGARMRGRSCAWPTSSRTPACWSTGTCSWAPTWRSWMTCTPAWSTWTRLSPTSDPSRIQRAAIGSATIRASCA